MAPSTESTFAGLIYREEHIFPVASNASDEHHSLVLLIGGLLMAQPCSDPRPSRLVTVSNPIPFNNEPIRANPLQLPGLRGRI